MLLEVLGLAAAVVLVPRILKKRIVAGPDADKNAKWGGTHSVVSTYVNGATHKDSVPLVVLLHGQASNAKQALDQFPLTRPALVVVPVGRFPHAGGLSYVDPALVGDARDKAMREEAVALAGAIGHMIDDLKPTPPRVMVVGLDASGPLAVALGLSDPLHVRYAWATGGVVPPSWVPLMLPQLNNLQRPQVRKLSFGNAIIADQAAAKLATERGMDFQVTVVPQGPGDKWAEWVLPDLEVFIETP